MHIFFSGIGGTGIGPLSRIAHQAGYHVSGSDKQDSLYLAYLKKHGVTDIHIGQSYEQIAKVNAKSPIDWFVFSSAVTKEQSDAPELRFCKEHGIRATKRDEFLSEFLQTHNLKLIAVAGTHGKTTTTAMTIWLFRELGIPLSYSVGANLSFGEMGVFDAKSEYFVYEADEYDKNFLAFRPYLSMITGIDWDHPDVYPSRKEYNDAFYQFLGQSKWNVVWKDDVDGVPLEPTDTYVVLDDADPGVGKIQLAGAVNRRNAWQVAGSAHQLLPNYSLTELLEILSRFPGVSRRFEEVAPHIFSDYAHTPPKIRAALQVAQEVAGKNVVVVYEGLHNTRQHFIKKELKDLFNDVKHIYVVPSYLAREDPTLPLLAPKDLIDLLSPKTKLRAEPAALNDKLLAAIKKHAQDGDTVLCITAGGGGSLDEWLRKHF